jgi:hypothetical protein
MPEPQNGLRTVVYNYLMIKPLDLQQNVDRIMDAHRRGLRDKLQTVESLRTLFTTLTEDDQRELCEQLGYKLRTEAIGITKIVRSVPVDVVGVTLLALARFGPTEHLAELVFSRIRLDNPKETETWAREVYQDFRFCLYQYGDRFTDHTLTQIRQSSADYRPTNKSLPLPLIEALTDLEVTVDNIELGRFERSLRHAESKQSSEAADLVPGISKLHPKVGAAMREAEEYLRSVGELDAKKAADLMRSSIDETHRFVVDELSKLKGEPYSGSRKDADRRLYMRRLEFISPAEEKFFSCIYSLISEEASHKLVAPRESMLVMHTTIHSYLLLLLRRMKDLADVPLSERR